MNISDPIADFLTRIRNGQQAKKRFVDIPWSRTKEELSKILKESGFIGHYMTRVDAARGVIRLYLKYTQATKGVIQGLKRVSKPGNRQYIKKDKIPYFFAGYGTPVLSTSQGVMTGHKAKELGVGGELLFVIW